MDINRVLRRKIVVLDGAMGTALIAKGYINGGARFKSGITIEE